MNRLLAVAACAALVFAACGSEESTTEASSPLAEFLGEDVFGGVGGDEEAFRAQAIEEERGRQDAIASCMQELGFEYLPVDPSETFFFGDGSGLEYGSDEWVEMFGFGMTTQAFSQEQVGPNLVGYDDSGFEEAFDNDPNQAYIDSLPQAEQEAYYEALYGGADSFPTFDETLTDAEIEEQMADFEFTPQGCEGEAYAEEGGSQQFYIEFSDEIDDMFERMDADPRVAEANAEISACVGDKGLTYTSMEDVWEQFGAEIDEMQNRLFSEDPFADISEEEFEAMSETEQEELFNFTGPELSDDDKARLGELQAEELELAKAVTECGGGFDAQQDLYNEIRVEYEQEFLDTYADRLEGFKASE